MDALAAGQNLFAADEEVARVGDLGVVRIGHGVERSRRGGELVEDVVVRAVFLFDELAEALLCSGAEVFVESDLFTFIGPTAVSEHLNTVVEVQAQRFVWEDKVLGRVELADGVEFATVVCLDASEDVEQRAVKHVHDLE